MKNLLMLLPVLLILGCDSNSSLKYKDGAPKNCRAIIKENIDGYERGEWSSEDVLKSIDRNCGENGYAW